MEHVNLMQGSPEWHQHRATHFNASDAPAMLGISPYKTRNELLREMATGLSPEIDEATQERFNDGHRFEALARPIAQEILGKKLYPVVATEGKFSASFDGISMDEEDTFEHKTLNDTIRACSSAEELPEYLRVQMEHQFMVGGERCLFMASKWDENNELIEEVHFEYTPDRDLRNRIIEGWSQFEIDLANYEHVEEVPVATGKAPESLPALRVEVTGMVTASNLIEFKETALAVFGAINRDLQTDEDFSNAEKTVKWCKEVESRLEATKEHALSQTASIDELFKTIDDIKEQARATRLDLDKLVKARKEAVRVEIKQAGETALADHINALNERLGKPYMPQITNNFAAVMKGKKTVASLRNAVDTELSRLKIETSTIADSIQANLNSLKELASDHVFLFADTPQLVLKNNDDLVAVIKARISDHEIEEEKRREADREKIRQEEQQKAEAAAQQSSEPKQPNKTVETSTSVKNTHPACEQLVDWDITCMVKVSRGSSQTQQMIEEEVRELFSNAGIASLVHVGVVRSEVKEAS